MDTKKIKVGKTVGYTSRKNSGRAKVVEVYARETGAWVRLYDKARAKHVTVRPSQVTA
jgi:hypothetical protein